MAKLAKRYFQTGGIKLEYTDVLPKIEKDVKSFFNNYLSSPKYKERLKAQGYTNLNDVITKRKAAVNATNTVENPFEDTQYFPQKGMDVIGVNPQTFKMVPGLKVRTSIAHEYGHVAGGFDFGIWPKDRPFPLTLNEKETKLLESKSKLKNVDVDKPGADKALILHDRSAKEIKADIDAFRYTLSRDKIYDTGTEEFSQEVLDKAKAKYKKDYGINRLFKNISDKDLIYLMNNIASQEVKKDTMPIAQAGGYHGTSIVDFLSSQGKNAGYANRKLLYKGLFADEYTGSADQNIKLLAYLRNNIGSTNPTPKTSPTVRVGSIPDTTSHRPTPVPAQPAATKPALESGVIVDKRNNQAYVVKNGKVDRSFPVLTGKNPNQNGNDYTMDQLETNPNLRNTPQGSYYLTPNPEIYGMPGYDLDPIKGQNGQTPVAKDLAMHNTYHPEERGKYYNMAGDQRNRSYGCINCRKPDLQSVLKDFPKGDTLMVIDPRNGQSLKSLGYKQTGGKFFDPTNNFQSQFEGNFNSPVNPNPVDPMFTFNQQYEDQQLNLNIPQAGRKVPGYYQPFISGANAVGNWVAGWKREQDYQNYYDQNSGLAPATTYLNKRQRFGDSGLPQAGLGLLAVNNTIGESEPNYFTPPSAAKSTLPDLDLAGNDYGTPEAPINGEDAAFKFFQSKGLPDHIAAGIVGNLSVESANFDPDVIAGKRKGDGGKATGVAQWHPDRWANVSTYLQSQNMNPYTLAGQLEGVWYELNNSENKSMQKLLASQNADEAANTFNRYYERSADKTNTRSRRAQKFIKPFEEGGTYKVDDNQMAVLEKMGYKFTILD